MEKIVALICFCLFTFSIHKIQAQCFSEQNFNTPGQSAYTTPGDAGTLDGQGLGGFGGMTAGSVGSGFGGGNSGTFDRGEYKGGDGSDGSTDLNGKGGDSFLNLLFSGTLIFNMLGQNGGGTNVNGSVLLTYIPQSSVEISLVEKVDLVCFGGFGGSIEVSAMGGLSPYQYALNGGTFGDSPIFSELAAGDYTVVVQDGGGGTDMLMVTLTSPTEIIGEIVSIVDNVCSGASAGSIEVTASGGTSLNSTYGYSINGSMVQNSGLFINLTSGFYVISIFDDNLCTTQLSTSITSPDVLAILVITKTDLTCAGIDDGSIAVEAFGGTGEYEFSIDDGPFESTSLFSDLSGGTHIVTVMDEEACTEEIIVFLNEPDPVTYDLMVTHLKCFGDEDGIIKIINLIGTGPFQFKLNDGAPTSDSMFVGLIAGEYDVTVIDSAGCEWIQDIELLSPDSLMVTVMVVMEVQCGGDSTGAVQLELQNGVGDITYSVDQTFNFTGLFENLGAGEYTASATDSMGCSTEVDFEIQESATFTLSIDTVINVSCYGDSDGSVTINVTDGIDPIQYTINGVDYQDSPLFSGLAADDYEVGGMDSTGCINSIGFSIIGPSPMEIDYFSVINIYCYGGMGGVVFSVMGGTPPYFYEDAAGNNIEFEENENVVDLGISAGDYIVTIGDSNGCALVDTVTITQNDSLQLLISILEGDNCGTENTGALVLDAIGGVGPHTFSINNGPLTDGVFDSLAAGAYLLTVFDSVGCFGSMIINIPQLDGLVLDSTSIGDVSCNGASDGFVEFFISNSNGPISIILDGIEYADNFIENLSGGIYDFVAQDEDGCALEIEVVIIEPDPLTIEITDVNLGEGYIAVEANGGTEPYRYSIDGKATFQDSSTFTGLEFKDYTITVIDANDCEQTIFYILDRVEELDFEGLKIYPNPTSTILFVECEEMNSQIEIDIISNTGQVLKQYTQGDLKFHSTAIEIPLEGISQGSHILKISDQNRLAYRRIIIIK